MGRPLWKEPVEKREADTALDPRRAAISRRSRASDSTRPRIRASDRSSETLFNLLRSDYALESMNTGPASFSSERRGALSNWSDISALSASMSDPERAALRMTLSDSEPRLGRAGLRRVRSPMPVLRSEASRAYQASASSEMYTPRFPPAFPQREMARERLRERFREMEREIERGQAELERLEFDERRRSRPSFAATERLEFDERHQSRPLFAATESATGRRGRDESGGPRFRFPARIPRYLANIVDENDSGQRSGTYITGSLHLPQLDIDGLGDRERSLRSILTDLALLDEPGLIDSTYSPDATQWELVVNDLGLQAMCDLWESEGSDGEGEGEGGEGGDGNEFGIPDHLWDVTQDRDETRRLTSLFSSRSTEGRTERL